MLLPFVLADPSRAKDERPGDCLLVGRVAPGPGQLCPVGLDRILPVRPFERFDRRPGGKISEHSFEIPLRGHGHARDGNFLEWNDEISIAKCDERAFRGPERLDAGVKAANSRSGLALQIKEIVCPHRDGASRHADPLHLLEESPLIEPMNRLPDGHEVGPSAFQARPLGRRHAVGDTRVRRRVGDLVGARVRRDDLGEVLRERDGGLPVPSTSVPAALVPRRQSRDGPEELGRVRGPVAGVIACVAGEVVLEGELAQISSRL